MIKWSDKVNIIDLKLKRNVQKQTHILLNCVFSRTFQTLLSWVTVQFIPGCTSKLNIPVVVGACLSGWRSAVCAPCVTNPSSGSTQMLPRVRRVQWTLKRCEGAVTEETPCRENTHIKYTRDDGQRSSLRHLTGNVDNDPKWPPCFWPLSNMPCWELDIDSTKIRFGQISQGESGWIGPFHKNNKKCS